MIARCLCFGLLVSVLLLSLAVRPSAAFVSTGTGGVSNLVNCTDSGGQHLNFNAATGLFLCGSSTAGPQTVTVPNNTPTTIVNVSLGNNTTATVALWYKVEVYNNVDLQVESGWLMCEATNKGGSISNNVCNKTALPPANTSGTLAVSWAITTANPALIQITANSSLTPATGWPKVTYALLDGTSGIGGAPGNAQADGSTKGLVTFPANDFDCTASGLCSIDWTNTQKATGAQPGALSAADWTTFNTKVPPTRTLNAGIGMQTIGDLSVDRTISLQAPLASSQVPVSDSGTGFTWKTLPNCQDVNGQHLNYNNGTNTWSCGTTGTTAGGVNAESNGITKGIATFASVDFSCTSGLCSLASTIAGHTFDNTNTWTVKDGSFTLQANGDATKQARFALNTLTPSTLRTFTLPDVNDTLGTLVATQTFSNKTLDNTNSAVLQDALLTLQDDGDNTKQAQFQLSAITTGTLRRYTLPDVSDTLLCLTCAQTPTNKNLSGATNTFTNLPETALAFTDVTTANASTSQHGLMQKYPGGTTNFLRADGQFAAPPGSTPGINCGDTAGQHLNYTIAGGYTCGTTSSSGGSGGGDFSTNTSTSVDSEILLFAGASGKSGKRATGTGIVTATAGVYGTIAQPASAVLGLTDSQSPTNKTFDNSNIFTLRDDRFTLQDDGNTTRQAQFQLSGITAGQTRVFTLPDFNGTLATLAGTETLSNKTLLNAVASGPLTAATVLGGSSVTSSLSLQSTSAVGTTDSVLIKGGNNGGTTIATFLGTSEVGIGAAPTSGVRLHLTGPTVEFRTTGSATNQSIAHTFYDNNATLEGALRYLGAASAGSRNLSLESSAADAISLLAINDVPIKLGTNNLERGRVTSTTFTLGANGTTNPVLRADYSAGSVATGLGITGQVAGSPPILATLSSGTNEGLQVDAKGSGDINFHIVSTGNINIGGNTARSFGLNRHTTANTAGNAFSLRAGGATSGATDKDGGALTLLPGQQTGTGRAFAYVDGFVSANSTGTSDGAQIHRAQFGGYKQLTNNTTVSVTNLTMANNTVASAMLVYGVEVFDGTDVQVETGLVHCHGLNKAGTIAAGTARCTKVGNDQDVGSGTLTVTWTITNANPGVVQVNANSSLTPSTGYPKLTYALFNMASQQFAAQ